jgi:hypothetical protein
MTRNFVIAIKTDDPFKGSDYNSVEHAGATPQLVQPRSSSENDKAGQAAPSSINVRESIRFRQLGGPADLATRGGSGAGCDPLASFFDVSADVLENVDPVFYGDLRQAAFKALGLN